MTIALITHRPNSLSRSKRAPPSGRPPSRPHSSTSSRQLYRHRRERHASAQPQHGIRSLPMGNQSQSRVSHRQPMLAHLSLARRKSNRNSWLIARKQTQSMLTIARNQSQSVLTPAHGQAEEASALRKALRAARQRPKSREDRAARQALAWSSLRPLAAPAHRQAAHWRQAARQQRRDSESKVRRWAVR